MIFKTWSRFLSSKFLTMLEYIMNTPRTKPIERWKHVESTVPAGNYEHKLEDDDYLKAIGTIIMLWPHIEEEMLKIFSELLDANLSQTPIRPLYYSIKSTDARYQLMKSLLETSPANFSKGQEYDELLLEFKAISRSRNSYAHGRWTTHESGKIYLIEKTEDELFWLKEARYVQLKELTHIIDKMRKFQEKLNLIIYKAVMNRLDAEARARGFPLLPSDRSQPDNSQS